MYTPDNWIVIKVKGKDPHYKILAGWSGGYTTGDSWRINSGIVKVEETDDSFLFYGSSGSCYKCSKEAYCLRMNNAHIWNELKNLHGDLVELMPKETNWFELDWFIS
jgi:hypothetical protein